jgi:putative transposase
MARKCPPGLPVHVIQRGNNRQACFAADSDFKAYANWLYEAAATFDVQIHAWVFMTNHVHLLMTPSCWSGISGTMQYLGRHYVRFFNLTHKRSGTLYEGRFRSSIVQERRYLLACLRYIEMNPVRARMVGHPADYPWSSHRAHALGVNAKMWTPHPEYLALGATQSARGTAYRAMIDGSFKSEEIAEIRHAARTGLALGSDRFRREIELLTGQRQHHLKRGPKPQSGSKPDQQFLL